jgi:hypothetical protein
MELKPLIQRACRLAMPILERPECSALGVNGSRTKVKPQGPVPTLSMSTLCSVFIRLGFHRLRQNTGNLFRIGRFSRKAAVKIPYDSVTYDKATLCDGDHFAVPAKH